MKKNGWFFSILLMVMLVVSVSGFAAPKPIVIKIGLNAPEKINTLVVNWEQEYGMALIFKNYVETVTNDQVKVEIYGNSQLGSIQSVYEMVKSGNVQAAIGTGVMPNFYGPFEVISIPFLFKSSDIAWDVFDNSTYWANLKEDLRKKTGMRLLAMGQNGTRHFTHKNKIIRTPADLKGEKYRVMPSPIFIAMMKSFGAIPIPIDFNELYTSLQTGVVNGEENPISVIIANNLQEVQKTITLDGHVWSEDAFIINDKFFSTLPASIKRIIMQGARQAEVTNRGIESIHSNGPGLEKLKKDGVKIYVPTDIEKAAFAKVAQPPVLKYLKEKYGATAVDGMLSAVKKSEKKFGYR
jgi:tripartite ATP-independent transporter DctP family solute receptor